MKALHLVKRAAETAVDAIAEVEAELAALRAQAEAARAQAQKLSNDWLHAASQTAAEEIARQRVEAERIIARAEARIPELEQRRAAAAAERARDRLKHHYAAIAGYAPTLIIAVRAAARAQAEAIALREAAVRELGEGIVAANIPHLAFRGLLLPDLVSSWIDLVEHMFNPPAPSAPRPVAVPPRAKASPAKPPITAAPAPPPARPPRIDPPPEHPDQCSVVLLRANVELGDGSLSVVGDRCTMMADRARDLVVRGAAEYCQAAVR
jgi:hypothetical protein